MTTYETTYEKSRPPAAQPPAPAQAAAVTAPAPTRRERHGVRLGDESFWRPWALRSVALWTVSMLALIGLRVATAEVRPGLREAQTEQVSLVTQRDQLALEVQGLNNVSRVRSWAEEHGMIRFADSEKRSAEVAGVAPPAPPVPAKPLTLRLELRPQGEANRGN